LNLETATPRLINAPSGCASSEVDGEIVMGDEIEAAIEGAKALREIAATGGKTIDAARDAGGWLDRIFGKGIEDTVAYYWSDRIRKRRIEAAIYDWGRLVELFHKVERRLNSKGIADFRVVPPKVALALIENATVEDDDDLHSLWANLLATALDSSADEVHRKYVSILSELTRDDAAVLKTVYDEWNKIEDKSSYFGGHGVAYAESVTGTESHDPVSIITLNRLGLIAPSSVKFETYQPEATYDLREGPSREIVRAYGGLESVRLTEFGDAFCKAVMSET
jgi:Abortive infection alpha